MSTDSLAFLCGIVIGLFVGAIIGGQIESHLWKSKAKDDGKIEYYIDENDSKQWRWTNDK